MVIKTESKGSFGGGFRNLCKREVGALSPITFAYRARASEDLVLRLGIYRKLNKHQGCVNTVSLNAEGNILISGSDDRRVILWDWDVGTIRTSFDSGHGNNVFQARFMPYTGDRNIVTSAADGEVRLAHLHEGGPVTVKLLARHHGAVHKIAIEPGSPHVFYSCGEDGLVQRFDLRSNDSTKLIICRSFTRKIPYTSLIDLNAITIDPRNTNFLAVAGSDNYARVYDIRKYRWDGSTNYGLPYDCFCPPHLIDRRNGITGLDFSSSSELIASYIDDFIYLFPKDRGLGSNPAVPSILDSDSEDTKSDARPELQVYKGHTNKRTVKGVSFFGPCCEYVTSGSDCGRIFIWRKKDGELLRAVKGDKQVVNCIDSHPRTTMIASCGIDDDIKIWVPNTEGFAQPVNLDELYMNEYDSNDDDESDDEYESVDVDNMDDGSVEREDDDFDIDDSDYNDDGDDDGDDDIKFDDCDMDYYAHFNYSP